MNFVSSSSSCSYNAKVAVRDLLPGPPIVLDLKTFTELLFKSTKDLFSGLLVGVLSTSDFPNVTILFLFIQLSILSDSSPSSVRNEFSLSSQPSSSSSSLSNNASLPERRFESSLPNEPYELAESSSSSYITMFSVCLPFRGEIACLFFCKCFGRVEVGVDFSPRFSLTDLSYLSVSWRMRSANSNYLSYSGYSFFFIFSYTPFILSIFWSLYFSAA